MPCPTDDAKNSVVSVFFVFTPVCGAPCKKYIPFFCKKLLTNRDQVAIINKRRGQQAQTKPTGDSHNGSAADSDSARGSSILSSPTTETAAARMLRFFSRGVAQMVARLVRDQEAVGSNPVTPTKKLSALAGSFFVASKPVKLPSSGLVSHRKRSGFFFCVPFSPPFCGAVSYPQKPNILIQALISKKSALYFFSCGVCLCAELPDFAASKLIFFKSPGVGPGLL